MKLKSPICAKIESIQRPDHTWIAWSSVGVSGEGKTEIEARFACSVAIAQIVQIADSAIKSIPKVIPPKKRR